MPLAAPALSALVKSKVLAKCPAAADNSDLTGLAEAIAEAVVEHITTAGVVTVNVVTACPAGAGTGSGSGTVA